MVHPDLCRRFGYICRMFAAARLYREPVCRLQSLAGLQLLLLKKEGPMSTTSLFLIAVVALLLSSVAIAAALPQIGTRHIPDDQPPSENLPIDKRWEELLPSQQALFKRSWYESMPEADEPPYPLNGPAEILSDIIKVQKALAMSGVLFATVPVDETGKGVQVTFHRIPDESLREVLGYALLRPQFKPAKCNGRACVMEYPVTASFERREPLPAPAPPTP